MTSGSGNREGRGDAWETATHRGVEELGPGGAGAAEEAVLGHQVLVCIHGVLHVLAADQTPVEAAVRGAGEVHPVVPLETTSASMTTRTRPVQSRTTGGRAAYAHGSFDVGAIT